MDTQEQHDRGLALRAELFGRDAVEKRTNAFGEFGRPLQHIINAYAYGDVWQRSALPLATKSLAMVAFDTLAAKDRAEASSVFHLLRNIGSSFFISLSIAEIVRTTGANYSRMSEMITPFNPVLTMPNMTGMWNFDTVTGLAKVAAEINRQSAMIGYLNAFMMYTATSAFAVVLVLLVRRRRSS